jgi:3-methyladenine DNA glycosylase AlkD
MSTPDAGLVQAVRGALAASGDPQRAAGQQRYMKSALPFRGLTARELRALLRPILADHVLVDRGTWEAAARDLWDHASHREEWYATLALLRHRRYRHWQDPGVLPLHLHLVRTGAWWDVVDETAVHLVGRVLADHRDVVTPQVLAWAEDDHLWVRRTAVLAQLRHRGTTDTRLLAAVLDVNLEGSRFGGQFFVRKAVGWALREYARTDPGWVRAYVEDHADRLSGLSRREALKHLG